MRISTVLSILACGALALACQNDSSVPSDLDRGIDLTAGSVCKDATFTAAATIYTSSTVQNNKLKACKTILGFVQKNQIGNAELEIDKLLVAIHNDYQNGAAGLVGVGAATLEQSVANYIGAACGLAPLSDDECLVPNDLNESGGITADELDGWIAAGPLSGTATALSTDVLENLLFAFGVDGGPAYVIVAQNRPTGVDGPCPETFAFDCQDDVFDLDVDKVANNPTFVTVESCTDFGALHAHCPEGQSCAFGSATTGLGLVPQSACDAVAYRELGIWGKLAYQTIRPTLWVVHATPAYAATSTKFGAFSPIVLADDDPRVRGVECIVTSSNFNAGSEGSTCRVISGVTQIASCVTVATSSNSSQCTLSPAVPDDITVVVRAAKTGGSGAYNASSAPFGLGPADPPRGAPNKQVCFTMSPPNASQVTCP